MVCKSPLTICCCCFANYIYASSASIAAAVLVLRFSDPLLRNHMSMHVPSGSELDATSEYPQLSESRWTEALAECRDEGQMRLCHAPTDAFTEALIQYQFMYLELVFQSFPAATPYNKECATRRPHPCAIQGAARTIGVDIFALACSELITSRCRCPARGATHASAHTWSADEHHDCDSLEERTPPKMCGRTPTKQVRKIKGHTKAALNNLAKRVPNCTQYFCETPGMATTMQPSGLEACDGRR